MNVIKTVQKRNGSFQPFMAERITRRLFRLLYSCEEGELDRRDLELSDGPRHLEVDINKVYHLAHREMYNEMCTNEIDLLLARVCSTLQGDYHVLAKRIVISCNHHMFPKDLSAFVQETKARNEKVQVYETALNFLSVNMKFFANIVKHNQDYMYSYDLLQNNSSIGRFQYVLLLVIINDVLTKEIAKGRSYGSSFVMQQVTRKYEELCKDPMKAKTISFSPVTSSTVIV